MTPQIPAAGILLQNDYGNSKWYSIPCQCSDDEHKHTLEVEADEYGINVHIYSTQTTNFWSEKIKNRYDIDNQLLQEISWSLTEIINSLWIKLKLTKNIWFDGYVKYESNTLLSEQQALNYAESLKLAIDDVKQFKSTK